MDSEEHPQKKQKREKPNKKWTESDIHKILEFLHESPEFEKPTAQIFYGKFIEKTGMEASWSMIRWKVRNLRICFNRASDWRKSTGAGLLETDEGVSSVKIKILRMCPYFDQLKEIFGAKPGAENAANVVDTLEESFIFDDNYSSSQLPEEIPPAQELTPTSSTSAGIAKKAREFAKQLKTNAPKSSIAQLTEIQLERSAMQKIKYELEKGRLENAKELQERQMKLEEEKFKVEQEWRKQEFELKKLEIEKRERIAMYEIEMKYKNNKERLI